MLSDQIPVPVPTLLSHQQQTSQNESISALNNCESSRNNNILSTSSASNSPPSSAESLGLTLLKENNNNSHFPPSLSISTSSSTTITTTTAATTTVKVAVRIRPLNPKEIITHSKECIRLVPTNPNQVIVGLPNTSSSSSNSFNSNEVSSSMKAFTFDAVFGVSSQQQQVYNVCVSPLVKRFLEGFNSTTLAYGQVNYIINTIYLHYPY
jgi:hypothetical protein